MNLLEIASKNGITFKRVGNRHGGEYHGPCPACGGTDRFHIWPEQGEHGTFWCRGCQLAGDAIEYLMKIEGMNFPAACSQLGKALPEQEEYQKPRFRKPASETFVPRSITAPADAWVEHASKFVQWAHEQLLNNQEQLDYLAARGINRESIEKFKLGYNPGKNGKDLYRAREAWGLETVMNGDKKKKLWLPIGIIIPYFADNVLRRVRIRIPADRRTERFSVPYYLVPGSSMDTFVTRGDAKAYTVVEAELDAIMIDQHAGSITGAMAMGNSTAKPTEHAFKLLSDCLHISNALDYDATETDPGKNPGGVGALWWQKHFTQVERWPVPVGKDPGDAFKAGINILEWVKLGLPPALTLPPPAKHNAKPAPVTPVQDNISGADSSASPVERETEPLVHIITAKDGRTVHITNDRGEYRRLIAEKKIVFNSAELALIKISGADQRQAARFIDAKQVFPGAKITGFNHHVAQDKKQSHYRGKYAK